MDKITDLPEIGIEGYFWKVTKRWVDGFPFKSGYVFCTEIHKRKLFGSSVLKRTTIDNNQGSITEARDLTDVIVYRSAVRTLGKLNLSISNYKAEKKYLGTYPPKKLGE